MYFQNLCVVVYLTEIHLNSSSISSRYFREKEKRHLQRLHKVPDDVSTKEISSELPSMANGHNITEVGRSGQNSVIITTGSNPVPNSIAVPQNDMNNHVLLEKRSTVATSNGLLGKSSNNGPHLSQGPIRPKNGPGKPRSRRTQSSLELHSLVSTKKIHPCIATT